jgi:hypothetical protein
VSTSPVCRTTADIREELLSVVDPKAADEKLLVELAAGAAGLALQVNIAADRLAQVLPVVLEDPKKALAVARVLHDLAVLGNVLVRRVEGTLSTAATLRLQRRVHRGAAE